MTGLFIRCIPMAAALALLSSTAAMGQQSTQTERDNKQLIDNLMEHIRFNGYAQAGYTYSDDGGSTSTLDLKRTLLWVTVSITDRWSCRVMHDFSSEMQEFYTDFRITKSNALNIRAGQFKNSYTLENPLSPTQMELIDVYSQGVTYLAGCGSDPLYGVQYGRDLGVMLFGDLFRGKLHYELALMNGQGINCKDGNADKDFIAKIEWRPSPTLRFVATGQKGRGHAVGTAQWNPDIEVGDDYTRDRLSCGGEWKSNRVGLHGEALWGKDGNVESWGAYLTGRCSVAKSLDVVASVDFFDRNTRLEYDQTNVTAGLQYWFYKKCRVQLQYTRAMAQWTADYNSVQAQVQVAF